MKTHEQYIVAILQNPEWMKSTIERYGHGAPGAKNISGSQLALAVADLENFMIKHFDVDEDAGEST